MADRIRKGKYFAYVRRQVWPDQAARVAALQLDGIGFIKESKRTYPNSDLGVARARLRRHRQRRAERHRGDLRHRSIARPRRHGARADRRAADGVQPRRAAADRGRVARADDRRVPAARRRARAARRRRSRAARPAGRRSSWTRTPARFWRSPTHPTSIRTPIATSREELRRNRAMQDLYEPGSTFKIVTASAALEERAATPATIIDASAGNIRFGSRVIRDDHNYGVLSFADVIVKSSNVGAIKVGAQARAGEGQRLRQALRLRPADLAGFSRRELRDRLGSGQAQRQRAGLGGDGLPGRRDAAADGRGGQRRRQRRRAGAAARGSRGDSRRQAPAGSAQGHRPADQPRIPPPR